MLIQVWVIANRKGQGKAISFKRKNWNSFNRSVLFLTLQMEEKITEMLLLSFILHSTVKARSASSFSKGTVFFESYWSPVGDCCDGVFFLNFLEELSKVFDLVRSRQTRVTKNSWLILIDNVYTTHPNRIVQIIVPTYGMSDHYEVCFVHKYRGIKSGKSTHDEISYRHFKNLNQCFCCWPWQCSMVSSRYGWWYQWKAGHLQMNFQWCDESTRTHCQEKGKT